MDHDYDLFVIGGGSGGVRAARISAQHGARVALAEMDRMGGTCVIRGCVPKKLMVYASKYPKAFADAAGYGWSATSGDFDWARFRQRLDSELARLEEIYRQNLDKAGVEIFDARARLDGPHTVVLNEERRVTAARILIATGGHPTRPEQFADVELGIVSDDVFHLDARPERLLIVGGGYIACEFAGIFNGMGSSVQQWHRGASILRGFDDEARGHLSELHASSGVELHLGTDAVEIERRDGGIWVKGSSGREGTFDEVLFATGRAPNTAGLGLEAAGVELGRKGQIAVDEWSRSSVPSIWAIGDVTDRIALTPVAIREGHAFADTEFGDAPRRPDHECVASAIFTQPEFGTVGLTEEAAAEKHRIEVYCTTFRSMHNVFVDRDDRVLFKLVVDAESRRVLGCHIVAPEAGEFIQLAAIAVKAGLTKEDFDRTVAVHPTMTEEIVTLARPVRTA